MPRFDGTGPNGEGPRTGRGMGNCEPVNNNDNNNQMPRPRRFLGAGRRNGLKIFRGRNR